MKFTCTQENLYKGLMKVQGLAHQATTLPILKNIYIEVKNEICTLKSTDLEIGISTTLRGKVEKEGSVTVDARLMSNFVSLLPQDKITLVVDGDNSLSIKGGTHKTKIIGLSVEDYPVIPSIETQKGFILPANEFKNALSQIIPSVSSDDTRPELHGVLFRVAEKTLTLVGTDSYRLAERKVSIGENKNFTGSCIVPLKTIKELIRTLDDEALQIEIYVAENQILFIYGQTRMVSRLVDGQYPDYEQIIPAFHTIQFTLSRDEFINAIKISGLFASVGSNSVTLDISPQKRAITISSTALVGEEQTEITADIEGENNLKIIFDYRYLLDGLQSIEDADVVFAATVESAPVLLRPKEEPSAFIYIIMPIRQ